MIVFPNLGKGLVVMTASEAGDTLIDFLVPLIAEQYDWPRYFPFYDESVFLPDSF